MKRAPYWFRLAAAVTLLLVLVAPAAQAQTPVSPATDATGDLAAASHRLIVELESPPLAAWLAAFGDGAARPDLSSGAALSYLARLESEQAQFLSALEGALPSACVSTYMDENGLSVDLSYKLVLNGMAVDPGDVPAAEARRTLSMIEGVKSVSLDYAHTPDLYASTELIGAPEVWQSSAVGSRDNAGAGIKVASMDGGIHHSAPMFDGTGFDYPAGYPEGGLGFAENNNGKIIASRAYFRSWDPPASGEANPWPGVTGTSHGVHTSSTAAGRIVDAEILGMAFDDMSGVAPGAWLMSYRVFYNSVTGDGSFYTAEGIAALEDITADGADVLNNSWGDTALSIGGEFDALDTALINATKAGVFVVMSAGNSGPAYGVTDHASNDYISVAASTTTGTLAAGRIDVVAPEPVGSALTYLAYGNADFGQQVDVGQVLTMSFMTAGSVDPANYMGCDPWEGQPFTGKAVLISRGNCDFSVKARNAQSAGAEMVIVYNNQGDSLLTMSCGDECSDITIPALFIGQTDGEAMVAWHDEHGDAAQLTLNTLAFQLGNDPDYVASFSSRGPGVGNVLKPDITAPGVNILAQGYASGVSGEARHLGYGQASGTSMAAPHITGAAAILKQVHPDWTNAEIKSAMMSTSKFRGMLDYDGTPAGPLEMGAGRIDLAKAVDPGVMLDPPSLSFGAVGNDEARTLTFSLTSIADSTQTFMPCLYADGAPITDTNEVNGFAVPWEPVTLAPGESVDLSVTFDGEDMGLGDYEAYFVLTSDDYEAHTPMWARVYPATSIADVLIIDNDASSMLEGFVDYTPYYTSALEALGYSYAVYDADMYAGQTPTLPDAATLSSFKAVIYQTGDNYVPDGTFTVPTPLTTLDQGQLLQYANDGGALLAMGQDLAAVLGADSEDGGDLYTGVLGGEWLQDSVSQGEQPMMPIIAADGAPKAFADMLISVGFGGNGAENLYYIDEISAKPRYEPDTPEFDAGYVPLLRYQSLDGPEADVFVENGVIAMSHRDEPTLERPGVSYLGSSIYTTFGLEGVNSYAGLTTREDLLGTCLSWLWDRPEVQIINTTPLNASDLVTLKAMVSSEQDTIGVCFRWDYGDGSAYVGPYESCQTSHEYAAPGTYTVRVEATDSYGHTTVVSRDIVVGTIYPVFLPQVVAAE